MTDNNFADQTTLSLASQNSQPTAEDDRTILNNREVDRLHADQESILEHLGGGPQSWPSVRRRLHVLGSETRASETRRQLATLICWGLIEESEDAQYRLM